MTQTQRKDLIKEVAEFKPVNILVIGDLILDQYNWGDVTRISPEAPIPVVKMEREEFRLGGAANVAANIHQLECEVFPVGIVGDCRFGKMLLEIMGQTRISLEGIIVSEHFQTIVKQRILTHQQQLLRLDYESDNPDIDAYEDQLVSLVRSMLPKVDGVIISDYAKGTISRRLVDVTVEQAKNRDIPVICDPAKGRSFDFYRGVTAIKPNRIETEEATLIKLNNREAILKAASYIKENAGVDFMTISLDKDGVLYYHDDSQYAFLKSEAPEVHDTTGAGDMFVSILGILIAKGASAEIASQLANIAAGLETSHLGVVSIPWSDIVAHLSLDGLNRKITSLERLKQELIGNRKQSLIFTNGYFDNISAGHLRFLMEISRLNGNLIVAINSDQSILNQKGSAPLLKEQDRARLLASIENVHRVVIFHEADASRLINELSPDIIVKGESFKNQMLPEQNAIDAVNAKVEYIQHFSWQSSP